MRFRRSSVFWVRGVRAREKQTKTIKIRMHSEQIKWIARNLKTSHTHTIHCIKQHEKTFDVRKNKTKRKRNRIQTIEISTASARASPKRAHTAQTFAFAHTRSSQNSTSCLCIFSFSSFKMVTATATVAVTKRHQTNTRQQNLVYIYKANKKNCRALPSYLFLVLFCRDFLFYTILYPLALVRSISFSG